MGRKINPDSKRQKAFEITKNSVGKTPAGIISDISAAIESSYAVAKTYYYAAKKSLEPKS
jgi:hypothetical protein